MTDNFYTDALRYDLVMGACASGDGLDFYQRQVSRYGTPVLELACGSGRLTIPLARQDIKITGLDLSAEMLSLAQAKAAASGGSIRFVQGDMRSFDLGEQFRLIFIPAQSLSHLNTLPEIEACFQCVQRHLADQGRFLIELFNPSISLLGRDAAQRFAVGQYPDPNRGTQVYVTEQNEYDAATQVNHIRWFFRDEASTTETELAFSMRQFFPQEIDALLAYNGFQIEHKYGSYHETEFNSQAWKQLIVCRSALPFPLQQGE